MSEVRSLIVLPWGDGAALFAAPVSMPWGDGAAVWSLGGGYEPPDPPAGGTPIGSSLAARFTIAAQAAYDIAHSVVITDLRDGEPFGDDVASWSFETDADSQYWSVSLAGGRPLYDRMKAGEQPPRIQITVNGVPWQFAVDVVSRSRDHAQASVQATGFSQTCAAGAPFEVEQNWTIEGDTTAAQVATMANVFTGLEVRWALDDWFIPAGVFSHAGTPLSVVKRLADAVGAVVQSEPAEYAVTVSPRYQLLPNEWPVTAPDVELALDPLDSESFQRADRPEYDGVYVSGHQDGAIVYVRLAGAGGGTLHPMITDPILTAENACVMRAMSTLGASGEQQTHTLHSPVLNGAGQPGVCRVGWLVRVLDDDAQWSGIVRGVRVDGEHPSVWQTLTVERHTKPVAGTVVHVPAAGAPGGDGYAPLAFSGPIPNQTFTTDQVFSLPSLAVYYSGGTAPYRYSMRSGPLPGWLELDQVTGVLSGTAPSSGEVLTLSFRAADEINSTADSNMFTLTVAEAISIPDNDYAVLFDFEGAEGAKTVANLGWAGGSMSFDTGNFVWGGTPTYSVDGQLSAAAALFGTRGAEVFSTRDTEAGGWLPRSAFIEFEKPYLYRDGGQAVTVGCRVNPQTLVPDGSLGSFSLVGWTTESVGPGAGAGTVSQATIWLAEDVGGVLKVTFILGTGGGSGTTIHNQTLPVGVFTALELCLTATHAYCFVNGALVHSQTVTRYSGAVRTGVGTVHAFYSVDHPNLDEESIYVDELFAYSGPLHTSAFTPRLSPIVPPIGKPTSAVALFGVETDLTEDAAAVPGGVVSNRGSASVNWSLAGTDLVVSPASGTLATGADVAFTLAATAAGSKTLTLTNSSGGTVAGSPAAITVAAAGGGGGDDMTFESLAHFAPVGSTYSGSHGAEFGSNIFVIDGTSTGASGQPSPTKYMVSVDFSDALMDVAAGFTNLSFWYASVAGGLTVDVYSGVGGTGSLIESIALTNTGGVTTWIEVTRTFGATARSIDFGPANLDAAFDDIDIT